MDLFGSLESARHFFLLLLLWVSPASSLLKENLCLLFMTVCWTGRRQPAGSGPTHPPCAGLYASPVLWGGFRFSEKHTPLDFTPVTVKFPLTDAELFQSWSSSRVHLKDQGQGIQDGLQVSTEDVLYYTIPISNRDTSFIIQWQNVSGLFPPIAEAIPEISCVQFSILVVQTPYQKGQVSGDTLTWPIRRLAFNSSSTGSGK